MIKQIIYLVVTLLVTTNAYSQQGVCLDVLPERITISDEMLKKDKLAALKINYWEGGRILKVRFLNGDEYLKSKVRKYAIKWSEHANIKFEFIENGYAEIRINFDNSYKSYSQIGKAALRINQTEKTMNFGWFDVKTPEIEFEKTIVHEFGHVLGCIHEHQNPDVSIPWKKDSVYKDYAGPPNRWTKDEVDVNIFQKYSTEQTQFSKYDKNSIMHYPISDRWVTDPRYIVGWNSTLSDTDKEFIAQIYPKPRYSLASNKYNFADLSGDGKTDLIHFVSNTEANVWLSKGDGQFNVAKVSLWAGYAFGNIFKTGDFNGDGKTDLMHFVDNSTVYALLSKGDGQFNAAKVSMWAGYGFGGNDYNFQTGDFNGDGKTDVIHFVNNTEANVWLSKGDGQFNVAKVSLWAGYAFGNNRFNFKAGDFNGDGKTDLIHFVDNSTAYALLSKGDGQFNVAKVSIWAGYAFGSNGFNFKTGDFNGDGKTDLIHFVDNSTVYALLSKGDGQFNAAKVSMWAGYGFGGNDYNFQTGDFNGDGKTDVIHFVNNTEANVWLSKGDGQFNVAKVSLWAGYAFGNNRFNFKAGDFNGDGKTDLIHFVDNSTAYTLLSKGDGQFTVTSCLPW